MWGQTYTDSISVTVRILWQMVPQVHQWGGFLIKIHQSLEINDKICFVGASVFVGPRLIELLKMISQLKI